MKESCKIRLLSVLCAFLFVFSVLMIVYHMFRLENNTTYCSNGYGDSNTDATTSSSISPTTPAPNLKPWEKDPLLPKDVVPTLYDLYIYPNLDEGTFTGNLVIYINVTHKRDFLLLHGRYINISDVSIIAGTNSKDTTLSDLFYYKKNQFWVMVPKKVIQPGSYSLIVNYSGNLTANILGFYESRYTYLNPNGTKSKRKIATTKFEPTYARQAFPCFDEPSFKAKFNITLVRPSSGNYIALSNMNQVKEVADTPSKGLTTVSFQTSVQMSTYLACFIVCDFEKLPPIQSKQKFPVTVYARKGQQQNMQFALQLAAKTIDYYIDYFQIAYPLPKLDLIAIPDFVSGAMENWGLITFRETSVLYNNETTSSGTQLNIAMTVAHELSHMWFGNLVTMKWWDDLWLNEGFASFMQYKGTHNSHPEWEVDSWFLIYKLHGALKLDSTLSSHPIVQTVSNPDQITEIFDSISYNKGSSVIRMLESFMGEENFRKGVSSYLKAFAYGNAETADLWKHLEEFSGGVKLSRVMGTWTRQMGYPVISTKRQGYQLVVTQSRFLENKDAKYNSSESIYKYKWDVPISFITSENLKGNLTWLNMEDSSVTLDLGKATWVKLNKNEKFYYRVNYGDEDWHTLTELLQNNHKVLDASDRANLLNDAFSLAEAGYIKYITALNLTKYLQNEAHTIPWLVATDTLTALRNRLLMKPEYTKFKLYVQSIVGPHITNATWDIASEPNFLKKRLAVYLLSLGCIVGLPACRDKTKHLFQSWIQDQKNTAIDVEIKSIVYTYGMQESNQTEWDILWQRYLNEREPQEKLKLRSALTAVRSPSILSKLIFLAQNEEYVRSQDYFSVLAAVARNPVGTPIIWDWIRENWENLVNRFTLNDRHFGLILPAITMNFDSKVKLDELQNFLKQHPKEGAGAAGRKMAVEKIQSNMIWNEKHYPSMMEFLNTYA